MAVACVHAGAKARFRDTILKGGPSAIMSISALLSAYMHQVPPILRYRVNLTGYFCNPSYKNRPVRTVFHENLAEKKIQLTNK